jgi:hypothetical protein
MRVALFVVAAAAVFTLGMAPQATAGDGPPSANDDWHPTTLVAFDSATGYEPGAGLIVDAQGVLYGTTSIGGDGPCLAGAGCGTVFALAPANDGSGGFAFSKLYDFQGGLDGESPSAPLALGPSGELYGYTTGGSPGTIWRLSPPAMPGLPWTFDILRVISGDANLLFVSSPLVYADGGLYGIASGGDPVCPQTGCGLVFRLQPAPGGGTWKREIVFTFHAADGRPTWIAASGFLGGLVVSTTTLHGAVVGLTPPAGGSGAWQEQILYRFGGGAKGSFPSHLVVSPDGVIHGTAGTGHGGLVFQLTPRTAGHGAWTATEIALIDQHGYGPNSLAVGQDGALVGTLEGDFDFFAGSTFQLTPTGDPATWTYTELWNFNSGPDRNPLNAVVGRGGNVYCVMEGGDSSNGSVVELHRP